MSENLVPAAAPITSPMVPYQAQAADAPEQVPRLRVAQALTPEYIMKHAVTPAMRAAAAERAAAGGLRAVLGAETAAQPVRSRRPQRPTTSAPIPTTPTARSRQWSPAKSCRERGYASSLTLFQARGEQCERSRNYIPVAAPDTITYPGSDYYEIALKRYTQQLHKDLPPTQLQGYVQVNKGTDSSGKNTIAPPGKPYYLGPMIIAQRDRPVRVKFANRLPTGSGGNLFLPVDTTI